MRKEIIFAIVAGAVFGIAVAVGLWRARELVDPKGTVSTQSNSNPDEIASPINEQLELAITSHTNNTVVGDPDVQIEGIASPDSWIAINSEDNQVVQATKEGVFTANVELESGINKLSFSAYNSEGNKEEESLILVYSESFFED